MSLSCRDPSGEDPTSNVGAATPEAFVDELAGGSHLHEAGDVDDVEKTFVDDSARVSDFHEDGDVENEKILETGGIVSKSLKIRKRGFKYQCYFASGINKPEQPPYTRDVVANDLFLFQSLDSRGNVCSNHVWAWWNDCWKAMEPRQECPGWDGYVLTVHDDYASWVLQQTADKYNRSRDAQ